MKDETKDRLKKIWARILRFFQGVKKRYDDARPDTREMWDVNICHVLPSDREKFEGHSPSMLHGDALGALMYVPPLTEPGDNTKYISTLTEEGWGYSTIDILMKAEKAGVELVHFHIDAPEVSSWPKFYPNTEGPE